MTNNKRKVLVIGGRGFIGRHVVKYLTQLGAEVIVGTRGRARSLASNERRIALHTLPNDAAWSAAIDDVDVVINTVGILRQRPYESYACIHHHAVAALACACRDAQIRLIHISALGLSNPIYSRFLTSKLDGELAVKQSGADWFIVRPSLVDGHGGFGARWFRKAARWPVHMVPASAGGRVAPIDVNDLGEAIARLALRTANAATDADREFDLGGEEQFTIFEYLNALAARPARFKLRIPTVIARLVAHICDLMHLTPYSFGHYELLKFDNLPKRNRLPELIGRSATRVGSPQAVPDLVTGAAT